MLQVVINPVAGNGRAAAIGEKVIAILEQKKIAYQADVTEKGGQATDLTRKAVEDGADTVVVVGGDGTVIEAASALLGTKTALGIIPAGTGNDFVKTIGISMNTEQALDAILNKKPRFVDTGMINQHFYLNSCGTGFDVMVLDYAEKAKKHCRGIWPYLYGVICTIVHYKPTHMKITIDDKQIIEGSMLLCEVSNGRFIGGGIPIAPKAIPNDHLLDLVVMKGIPRWKLPFYLPGLLMGKILKFKATTFQRVKKVSITEADRELRMNIDGEIRPAISAAFSIMEDALLLHW